jgi:PEP-CTERM motif
MKRTGTTTCMLGVALVAGLGLAPQTLATPILGMTISTDMSTATGYDIANVINGSGLAGDPALSGQHASASTDNAWLSTATSGNIIIDLGGDYDLSGFTFWNTNWDHGTPNSKGKYGIKDVTFLYALDGSAFMAIPGAPTTLSKQNSTTDITPDIFSFTSITADTVKIMITGNHGADGVGMAEIQFDGSRLESSAIAQESASVPEPTTLAMLCLGLTGLGVARQRTARQV